MKTIYLVTGAAGFMGTNVCAQLLDRGDAVRAFVLKGDPAVKFMPKAVEIFEGDLCSAEDCEKFFAVEPGVQTVCIHCASMVTINPNYSEKLIAVNVGGTENMLNAAKNHPECKKFVYVSSTGAIPELPKGESIHEVYSFVPYDDDRVVGWYSRSKAMATQKVLDAAADGLNACVVHPSGILGPNDPAIGQTTRTLIQILNGEMPIGMQGSFNLVDVRDLAAGTIAAADRGRKGECYILSNRHYEIRELLDMLRQIAGGRRLPVLPLWMARAASPLLQYMARRRRERPLFTRYSLYTLSSNDRFSHDKATCELGYRPRDLFQTLRDTVAWLREKGPRAGKLLGRRRLGGHRGRRAAGPLSNLT